MSSRLLDGNRRADRHALPVAFHCVTKWYLSAGVTCALSHASCGFSSYDFFFFVVGFGLREATYLWLMAKNFPSS